MPGDLSGVGNSKKSGTGDCLIMLCCLVRSQPLVSPKKTDKAGGVKVGCSDAREAIDDAQLLAVETGDTGYAQAMLKVWVSTDFLQVSMPCALRT